ncbi:hypothetical protein J2Z28_000494 [Paenibacillus xylanexedens]|uniref:Uncharacterized protein n=2 Tax=Paenibacillus xylanexedens TaxID=528191 RepID=A0ABS4RNM6_PAEXY|nr:hypothetical protein [Paenibacillus xylanexedens]
MIDINEELADMDDKLRTMGYDGVEDASSKLGMLNRTIEESTPALLKMKDAEIQKITPKYRQVEASEALLDRYKELASAQTLDQAQKQELASTVDQLRKKYPDLNRVMGESERVRVQNIDIIGEHIAAERSFIDQSAQVVNAYVANMKAMAEANLALVKAQISNYENLAKAMSSVGGIQSAPFKKNVTGIGGVSVNPTLERLANEESTMLDGLYDKQVKV